MDAKEFNDLLKVYEYDPGAANKLFAFCLSVIQKRLRYCNGSDDLESLSHSILAKFIKNIPDYVLFPEAYLCKCTNNYLSSLKKKEHKDLPLIKDICYEQRFNELEKFDIFNELEKHLDNLDAVLIYGHYVEDIPEKQLAEENGLKPSTARQRICRAKKKLKKILSQMSHR